MAGLGYKDFTAGAILTAAQVDGYLMEQAVMNFAGTAARGSALSSVQSAGMMAHVGGGTVTVYDGSAWQQVYPVATSPGLVFVAGTAFSAAASVSVNNCFTSTYDNYRIVMRFSHSVGGVNLLFRLRASGSDTATNYDSRSSDLGATYGTGTSTTEVNVSAARTEIQPVVADLTGPNLAARTTIQGTGMDVPTMRTFSAAQTASTQFDGFTFYPVSGSITGHVRVYSYRNA